MRRLVTIVFAVFLLGSVFTVGLGGATSTTAQFQETTTGISMGPAAESDIDNLETIESTLEQFGVNPPSEVTILATSDGERHIVFSSDPIPAGEATIEGRTYPTTEATGQIIVADTVSVETTGDRISFADLQDNASQYNYELIRFDADGSVISTATKPTSGVSNQQTSVYLGESGNWSSDIFQQPPGELASSGVLTESNRSVTRSGDFQADIPENPVWGQAFSHQFWGEGSMTVDAAVVPVTRQGSDGDPYVTGRKLVVADVSYDSQQVYLPDQIRSGSLEGETVTIESDIAGASISTQEYLTSVASCGGKSVSVPMSPPICVPVTNDLVVHTGVIAEQTEAGEMPIYYAGLSNTIQNSPTETETGRYRLTGEVVSASEIDPSLEDGYALRVYDMERVGDANIASSVTENAGQFEERIKSQLELDDSEWGTEASNEGGDNSGGESGGSTDGSDENDDSKSPSTDTDSPKRSDTTHPENPFEITDATVQSDTVSKEQTFEVKFEYVNEFPEWEMHNVSIYANGELIKKELVGADSGERNTTSATIWSGINESGEYTITVGAPNGEEAGTVTVEEPQQMDRSQEEKWHENGLFGQSGHIVGYLLMSLGILAYIGSIGVEVLRGVKHYLGDGSENGLKPALITALIGCAGIFTGGILLGDLWTIGVFVGFGGFIVIGGVYVVLSGVPWLYQRL